MNFQAHLTETNAELASLRAAIPDTSRSFAQLAQMATKAGALDTKTKELIALAIGVTVRCDACIGFHVKAAIRQGATRDEVAEAIGMCVYMGGGPALMYGGKALAAFDELSAG